MWRSSFAHITVETPLVKPVLIKTRKNSSRILFECYRQKIGLIFSKHNNVLVSLMGQNTKCPGYNLRKEPRRQVQIDIFDLYSFHHHRRCWPILAYDVPRTEDVGLRTKFRLNVGPASQHIAGQMPVNRPLRWPNTNSSLDLLYNFRKHVAFTQCCFNVDPQFLTLARH